MSHIGIRAPISTLGPYGPTYRLLMCIGRVITCLGKVADHRGGEMGRGIDQYYYP